MASLSIDEGCHCDLKLFKNNVRRASYFSAGQSVSVLNSGEKFSGCRNAVEVGFHGALVV